MIWLPLIAMPSFADPTAADQQVGAWAFVIVLALVVGTFLLWFNMRKQLGKINVPYANETDEGDVAGESGETGETGEGADGADGPEASVPPAEEEPTQP